MRLSAIVLFVLAALLSGCGQGTNDARRTAAGETSATETPAPERSSDLSDGTKDSSQWHAIRIDGYTCGDNCYVDYTPLEKGGIAASALCSAETCGKWEAAAAMPAGMIGKKAQAKFGTSAQIDGSGTVMNPDYLTITDLRIGGS